MIRREAPDLFFSPGMPLPIEIDGTLSVV